MRKEKTSLSVALGDIIRKPKVFWVFKLLSSRNILHPIAQSPNLIHYSRVMFFMTVLLWRRVWRTSYSKKSYPHHYGTKQQYFKSTHPRASPHSSQKTINIISMTLFGRMHQYPKLFLKFIPRFKFDTRITANLNLRYCKIRTQTLSQNLAHYRGINGVVAFTRYWLLWLRFIKENNSSAL
jgi:hypothetical protein